MNKCNICKKKTSEFYCPICKEKEIKKLKQNIKASKKRRLESTLRKFNDYLKSGKRTY